MLLVCKVWFWPCVSDDVPNNLSVDGAGDTVLQLQVHLGHSVLGEYGGV